MPNVTSSHTPLEASPGPIGFKLLSGPDLGRNSTSNQTHIGLQANVFSGWEKESVREAVLLRFCAVPIPVAAYLGPITNPDGSVRSPKIRTGDNSHKLPSAVKAIREGAGKGKTALSYGTLQDGRLFFVLIDEDSEWAKSLHRTHGFNYSDAIFQPSAPQWLAIESILGEPTSPQRPGINVIYFGPPGVGKSFEVNTATKCHKVFRTVFHPEYSYSDFVGVYKPVVGSDPATKIQGFESSNIDRPIPYYAFEPGIFTRALVTAYQTKAPTALIIEEINRGDCAAIFGDIFQLLDREPAGRSQYGIQPPRVLSAYLQTQNVLTHIDDKLFLPENLSLFATMNTSDQALYPMDAAFKRRWAWKSVPVMAGAERLSAVMVENPGGTLKIQWLDLVSKLNAKIVEYSRGADKRIGPWYLIPSQLLIGAQEIREKLLFYLWHDVFRHNPTALFQQAGSFDEVQQAFDKGGLESVFPWLVPPVAAMVRETPYAPPSADLRQVAERNPVGKTTDLD